MIGLVELCGLKAGIAGVLLFMHIRATSLSVTLVLRVVLCGLGQRAIELYAVPCKVIAFQKVGTDHGTIPNLFHDDEEELSS